MALYRGETETGRLDRGFPLNAGAVTEIVDWPGLLSRPARASKAAGRISPIIRKLPIVDGRSLFDEVESHLIRPQQPPDRSVRFGRLQVELCCIALR